MNKEFKRMQKLAGLITESEHEKRVNEVVDNNTIQMIFDERIQDEYKPLIGTDPIYGGLEKVLNSPKLFQKVTEWVNDMLENEDDEDDIDDTTKGYASDATDYKIMETFAPYLAKNLIKVGFTYNKNKDIWTVPKNYLDKTNDKELTSYGIIWEIWGVDYDTSPREIIGEYLQDAAAASSFGRKNVEEGKRIRKLAGLITEEYGGKTLNDNIIQMVFDERIQDDYKPLIGTDPIYNGLEKVLNSPELLQKVTEWVNNQLDDEDNHTFDDTDDIEYTTKGYASDATDYKIMETFAPYLVRNLIRIGFTYDGNEDIWTVPKNYSDKASDKGLTSYGIIWDIWGVDYDTSLRETIGEYLQDAAGGSLYEQKNTTNNRGTSTLWNTHPITPEFVQALLQFCDIWEEALEDGVEGGQDDWMDALTLLTGKDAYEPENFTSKDNARISKFISVMGGMGIELY